MQGEDLRQLRGGDGNDVILFTKDPQAELILIIKVQ